LHLAVDIMKEKFDTMIMELRFPFKRGEIPEQATLENRLFCMLLQAQMNGRNLKL
jgi:hypothetical protein